MFDAMIISKEQIFSDLKPLLASTTSLRLDESLAKKTTLRVGGPADVFVEPASETELSSIVQFCNERTIPWMALGRGSNLLIRDGGIRGVVISFFHPEFSKIEIRDGRMHCGAGAKLKSVSVEARRNNLSGFEFLEGIPGSVGGALRMNAGAMGGAMFDLVEHVRIMDGQGVVRDVARREIDVNYRSCPLLKENIAISAVLRGQAAPAEEVALKMKEFSHKRWDSQPAQPSAGCIFKNALTIPAGKLVDELGLKGTRIGGAMVSDIHGNFIVNEANATARNVLDLIELVKQRAKDARGIELETEVQIVGED
nr:UDP-N-acetylenolpyruvoylglucosamine reductase [uncultured bacterium]